jgi:hypothetical protein
MSDEDARHFASTKHDNLPEKSAGAVVIAGHRLVVPRTPTLVKAGAHRAETGIVTEWIRSKQGRQKLSAAPQPRGDQSIWDDYQPLDRVRSLRTQGLDMSNVTQVLSDTGHKVAAAYKRFQRFELSDGVLLEPRPHPLGS